MATGFYEIGLELYSLSSTQLETRTFYTVLFDVDQRQVELSQKKSTNQPGSINFNQSMSLRVTHNDLERARYEGKLTIYSIHHYGRKRLFGNATFHIDVVETQQLRIKLKSCNDDHAFIEFRCRVAKIESRVSSRQPTQNSFLKHDLEDEIEHRGDISILEVFKERLNSSKESRKGSISLETRKETSIEDIRTTAFQLPYRAETSISNISPQSISKNLSLMQSYENALKGMNSPESKDLQKDDYTFEKKTSSKALVLEKISKMNNDLNAIHEKQDLLKDDSQIEIMVQQTGQKRQADAIQESADNSRLTEQYEGRLRLESHNIDVVFYDKMRSPRIKVHRFASDDIRRIGLHQKGDGHEDNEEYIVQKSTVKQETAISENKLALIKPKTRNQSLQEWQNDDNLVNIVHEMINDVKGDLGYVKLSKLSQLRKKIKGTKDQNKNLLHANEILIQSERFLTKKLQIAEEIISEKQKLLATEFESLREQFKQVTKKLLEKYSEEVLRENKIKEYQAQNRKYQQQVKELEEKLQLKNKQVQHLKKLLASEEQNQKEKDKNYRGDTLLEISAPVQESRKSQKQPSKDPRFKRVSSANKIFRTRREDSDSSRYDNLPVSEINLESKKSLEILKGITPTMQDFFLTFIAKPEESAKATPANVPRGNLKKARFHHQKESSELQASDEASINAGSRLFLQI